MFSPTTPKRIGLIGTGSVGSGWAAIYLARDYEVVATDAAADAEQRTRAFVTDTWSALHRLGFAKAQTPPQDKLKFVRSASAVASSADLVHENVPENLDLKRKTYDEIESLGPSSLVIASSTGGIRPSELQAKMRHPERLIVCHPFNPPHLVPLIEIIGGEKTAPELVDWALAFFRALGKRPIRVEKEVTAFLTNRLQFALLREAVNCVTEGIASPQAIEDAIRFGLGPRWAVMGSLTTFTLAGGEGGMPHVLKIAPELQKWFDTLGTPKLTSPDVQKALIEAAEQITAGRSLSELIATRNRKLVDLLLAVQLDEGSGDSKAAMAG
jgi:carnitine 3-dehydrogenase